MAKVLSSISGNLISAASAGYAPTNSGDVSAIASGYQVVSATGTQLYAGTAHVTSINLAPLSASRAGQAANASMATSAYYDGTGRLISALPDSAAVSSIASAYATAKQDASAMTAYAKSADVSGTVNTVVNNSANWNSVYNTVSSNSASWSGSTGGGSVTSPSGTIFVDGDKIEGTNSAVLTASGTGFEKLLSPQTQQFGTYMQTLAYGTVPGTGATLMLPLYSPAWTDIIVTLSGQGGNGFTSASGVIPSGALIASIPMDGITGNISASAEQWVSLENSQLTAKKEGGITVTGIGELAWASSVSGVVNTVSSNSATWGQGGVDSATVSSIASSYAESAVSSKADSSALSSYALSSDVSGCIDTVSSNSASWSTTIPIYTSDGTYTAYYAMNKVEVSEPFGEGNRYGELTTRTLELNRNDGNDNFSGVTLDTTSLAIYDQDGAGYVNISSIQKWNSAVDTVSSNSASWAQGGVDSATVSAIASSYVESGVSSKADSSALSSYALSADVSGCIDTVSSNSASWGQGGAVTSPSGTIYVSGSTIEASNSALDVKYYPAWSSEINTDYIFSPGTGFTVAVSGSGNLYLNIIVFGDAGSDIYVYGLPDGVLIGSGTYERDYRGIAEISFAGGYSAISACPNNNQILLDDSFVTASGASYYTTSVGTLAWESAVSSKADSSALSSYALSADVSSTVDVVSSQSANWGGSALALSAGPGVSLTKSGNTLVAGLDETVLWSGNPEKTTTTAKTYSLSEDLRNFARYRVVVNPHEQSAGAMQRPCQEFTLNLEYNATSSPIYAQFPAYTIGGNILTVNYWYLTGAAGTCTSLGLLAGIRQTNATVTTGITSYSGSIVKIVGLDRTAGI